MKTSNSLIVVIIIFAISFLVGMLIANVANAEPQLRWTHEWCMTNGCITDILNKLPPERATEAKIAADKTYTYIWYRK